MINSFKSIGFIVIVISIQSCFVAKDYSRANDTVPEQNYRTDQISQDSLSLASVSWKELFIDPKLKEYIQRGLDNNLDIRMAMKNIDAAEAYVKQGKAAYFPTLNGNASYTYSTQSLNTQFGEIIGDRAYLGQYELSASLGWEADIWGKIRSGKRAFTASYLQSVAAHQAVKSDLVASIASTYFQLLALDEQKRIAEETISNRTESVETIELLKDAGNVTEVAVKQTEAQLLNAQALLLDIENEIKILENTFCILLGEPPHEVLRDKLKNQKFNA